MIRGEKEWEVKLQLLDAITRSQTALAKILENVAGVTDTAGVSPATLNEHVRVLTGMQEALLRTVSGSSWQPPVRGKSAAPWLSDVVKCCHRNVGGASY